MLILTGWQILTGGVGLVVLVVLHQHYRSGFHRLGLGLAWVEFGIFSLWIGIETWWWLEWGTPNPWTDSSLPAYRAVDLAGLHLLAAVYAHHWKRGWEPALCTHLELLREWKATPRQLSFRRRQRVIDQAGLLTLVTVVLQLASVLIFPVKDPLEAWECTPLRMHLSTSVIIGILVLLSSTSSLSIPTWKWIGLGMMMDCSITGTLYLLFRMMVPRIARRDAPS